MTLDDGLPAVKSNFQSCAAEIPVKLTSANAQQQTLDARIPFRRAPQMTADLVGEFLRDIFSLCQCHRLVKIPFAVGIRVTLDQKIVGYGAHGA
jgi:hypothetical protein